MTDHFADAGKPMPEPLGYFRPEPLDRLKIIAALRERPGETK